MVVIPFGDDDNESRSRSRAPYSQTLDELLGSSAAKPSKLAAENAPANSAEDTQRMPPVTALRQIGRPATRHGSRSGSSAANTVGSASSTSASSASSTASSSSSSATSNQLTGSQQSANNNEEPGIRSPNSESHSTSAGPASVNVWSRDDGDDENNSERDSAAIAHDHDQPAISEEDSFSKKLQELASRSLKARSNTVRSAGGGGDATAQREAEADANATVGTTSDAQRRLSKVPSVILERNESSETASNRSLASSSPSADASRKSSQQSLPSARSAESPTANLQNEDLNGNGSQVSQASPSSSGSNNGTDDGKPTNIANIRRKWQQQAVGNGHSIDATTVFASSTTKPTPLTRSKTIAPASTRNYAFNGADSKPPPGRTEKESTKASSAGTPFVSRFANGIMIGTSMGPALDKSKAAQPTPAKKSTRPATPSRTKRQAIAPIPQTRPPPRVSNGSLRASRSSSTPKSSSNGAAGSKTNDLPFESTLSSQGRAKSGGGFELWLKQKAEEEKKRRRKAEQQKAEEERRNAEKKRDAERCFERWKAERERALAAQKQKIENAKKIWEENTLAEKEEKRRNAERTFEHWKKTHMEEWERQRTKSSSAQQRRTASASKREAVKKEEAKRAFEAWLRQKEEKQRAAEAQKIRAQQEEEERKKREAEEKQQISKEAYELWLHVKEEQQKYSKSLAYKILEFESEAKRRWPSTPWLPTGNTVPRRFTGSGHRRKTLERPLNLRHSRASSGAASRARSLH